MGERYKLEVRPETGTVIDLIDTKTYDIVCDFLHTDTHDQSREAQHVLTALNFHEHDRPKMEARMKKLEEALKQVQAYIRFNLQEPENPIVKMARKSDMDPEKYIAGVVSAALEDKEES